MLSVDVGNSSLKLGLYDGSNLVSKFTVPTLRDHPAQKDPAMPADFSQKISAVIVSSVVPELNKWLGEMIKRKFAIDPIFVDHALDLGLDIKYRPPSALGADRLVAAFAAAEKYGKPCIVCDFGTAATIDAVNGTGEYLGGTIAPGMTTLADALHENTSKLPRVNPEKPGHVIGDTTEASIRSGVFYGYIGLVEGILKRIIDDLGESPIVVATGGSAAAIAEECELIDVVDENLILDGLNLIAGRFSRA